MYHHHSDTKIDKLYNVAQKLDIKPCGLWFTNPGEWLSFSGGETRYLYEIIKLPSNILYIREEGMSPYKFCEKYCDSVHAMINWKKVCDDGYSEFSNRS